MRVDEAALVHAKVPQKRMLSAHRILGFLSKGPQTSNEFLEKMKNVRSDTISVSNFGNRLKQIVIKGLVVKENLHGGTYSLATKKSHSSIRSVF